MLLVARKRKQRQRYCNDPKQRRLCKKSPNENITLTTEMETPYTNNVYNRNHKVSQAERERCWIAEVGLVDKTWCPACSNDIYFKQVCGFQVTHLHAKSLGGPKELWNLSIGCMPCNNKSKVIHFLQFVYDNNLSKKNFDQMIQVKYNLAKVCFKNIYKKYYESIYLISRHWYGSISDNDGKIPLNHPLWQRIKEMDIKRLGEKQQLTIEDQAVLDSLKSMY